MTYSGICIGGDMDGLRLAAERSVYKSPIMAEPISSLKPGETDAISALTGYEVYVHATMHFVDGKGVEEIGFWLHPDYPTLRDALNRMADVYSNATKATKATRRK